MNWQLSITFIIIAMAAAITIRRTIRFFQAPPDHCSGCARAAKNCSLMKLREEIKPRN